MIWIRFYKFHRVNGCFSLPYLFFLDYTGESGDREAKRVRGRLRRLPFYSGDLSEAPEKKGRRGIRPPV